MKKILTLLTTTALLTGCGGSAPAPEATNPVNGSVSAPSGGFTFNEPGKVEQFFASLIGSSAIAKIDGLAGVGAGVTVNLIEIDANGAQVGAIIATATTDSSGSYILNVPATYSAAAKYAIVAEGTSDTVKSMWEGSTVDVDPGSNATMSALLDATSDLSTIDTKEISSARELIEDFTEDLSASEATNTTNYTANLKAALQNDSEAAKMLSNKTAAGEVCGTVTNASDNPVENIRIFARDFSDFSKMAKTKTAADGTFCFNAPVGQELMVGAINRTTTSDTASEFYTAASPANGSGTKCHLIHCADKLTVTSTSSTTANFQLVQGGVITGTITGDDNALKKVKVLFRNALTKKPAGATKTNKSGVYRMNLAPGDYIVYFKNSTKKAFGSTAYTTNTTYYDSGQAVDRNFAEKLILTAGSKLTADAALLTGGTLTGTITDNNGDPVEFAKLRIDQIKDKNGNTVDLKADRFHTNKLGVYRAQLPFGTYTISARGEFKDGVSAAGYTLDSSNLTHTINFDHQTNAIAVKLTDGTNGIGSITAKLRNTTTGKTTGNPTMSDGTTTLYVPDGNYTFSIIVNNGANTASCNWNGTTCSPNSGKDLSGDAINITGDDSSTFANITMPTGFPISGTVKDVNGDPLPGAKIIPQIEISPGVWKTFVTGKTGADGMYTVTIPGDTAYRLFAKLSSSIKGKYLGNNNGNGCKISAATTVDFDGTEKTADFTMVDENGDNICP